MVLYNIDFETWGDLYQRDHNNRYINYNICLKKPAGSNTFRISLQQRTVRRNIIENFFRALFPNQEYDQIHVRGGINDTKLTQKPWTHETSKDVHIEVTLIMVRGKKRGSPKIRMEIPPVLKHILSENDFIRAFQSIYPDKHITVQFYDSGLFD